jgi:hypothetical protein
MRRSLILGLAWVVIGGLFAVAAPAARAADATGKWAWSFERQGGEKVEITLELKQDGEKLTGTITGMNNSKTDISDGTIKNGEIAFKVVRERNGNTFTTHYKGKLDGDTIKGKSEMERNGEKLSRDWEAKRAK